MDSKQSALPPEKNCNHDGMGVKRPDNGTSTTGPFSRRGGRPGGAD